MARDRGYAVIRVLSTTFSDEVLAMLPAACKDLQFAASIQHTGDVDATLASIRALGGGPHNGLFEIIGLTCGCESGVELADAISARYGKPLKTNGEELKHHRRDKYLMGERVREAGLKAAQQVETNEWEGIKAFAEGIYGKEEDGGMEKMQLVLKPVRSAGTENVFFVSSLLEAKRAFDTILGDQNLFGETNDKVLVQEFLSGKEYVVDCVSKDGVHKCVAIWVYDKVRGRDEGSEGGREGVCSHKRFDIITRPSIPSSLPPLPHQAPCNGSKFVYLGVNLFESEDGVREERMAAYVFQGARRPSIKENSPSLPPSLPSLPSSPGPLQRQQVCLFRREPLRKRRRRERRAHGRLRLQGARRPPNQRRAFPR